MTGDFFDWLNELYEKAMNLMDRLRSGDMQQPEDDSTKRARIAYEAFRGGLLPWGPDVPRWEDAPSWIRDVAVVAYLQGKLDAPKSR